MCFKSINVIYCGNIVSTSFLVVYTNGVLRTKRKLNFTKSIKLCIDLKCVLQTKGEVIMKRLLAILLSTFLVLGMFAGCGQDKAPGNEPSTEEKETDATNTDTSSSEEKETDNSDLKLTIYVAVLEDYMIEMVEQFTADTGIQAEAVKMGAGEILSRVRAEKENPKASVWFGGGADSFIQANEEGLLEAYVSPTAEAIDAKYKDADGAWTGIYTNVLGFASNKKLLEERGIEAPTSWEDLLKPEFQGQISMASPASSGTSYLALSAIVQLQGEEEGLKYMAELDKNVKTYEKSGSAPARLVGQGEVMVSITYLKDAIAYREEGFTDIVMTTPSEGTGYEIGAVAILKDAPDMDAAKIFVDWALTAKAQEIGPATGTYQNLTHPEAKQPEQLDEISDVVLMEYDLEWSGKNRNDLIEKWNQAVNQ